MILRRGGVDGALDIATHAVTRMRLVERALTSGEQPRVPDEVVDHRSVSDQSTRRRRDEANELGGWSRELDDRRRPRATC